ncbi:hypothetical protein [Archaeoglobus neptunius]|uniref:hypothetical protein n=1 Tax=Archaeoglobus neptunius TaxID=2798580 RepID=UPI001925F2F5|nr:hypothetical protein [Archaeoglobus neptunius]
MKRFVAHLLTTIAAFCIFISYRTVWKTTIASALLSLDVVLAEGRLEKRDLAAIYIAGFIIYTAALSVVAR